MSNSSKKTPWHLRFAPGAILRKKGLLAILALAVTVTVLTTIKANPVAGATKYLIPVGTWLVAAIGEGLVGQALSDYLTQAEGQKAYATVHGSRWLSHEFSHQVKTPTPSIPPYGGNWTTSADMGDRNDLASAFGWWGNLKRSMTHDEAIDILDNRMAKVSIVKLDMSYWDPTARVRGKSGRLYPVVVIGRQFWAREDRLAIIKASELRKIRQETGNPRIVWYKELQRETFKWNVGSFGMFSDFEDEKPILTELGESSADDSRADYYSATATWKERYIYWSGRSGQWRDRETDFDEIKSWEDHHFSHDFCRNNLEITEPAIYNGITRYVTDRQKLEYQVRLTPSLFGPIRTGSWRVVGSDPVVVHDPAKKKGD